MPVDTETRRFSVVEAESGKPIELAMEQLWLQGQILPVGARLMVRHVFRSGEAKPLEVIYTFALPRDAALRQFVVTGENFRVRSKLKPTEEAVKEYEAGIRDGHLSTLARQYGDGVVSLTVGNIRPKETVAVLLEVLAGVEAHDDGLRFRFPFTLAPAYHRRARATEISPGIGEIELPEDEFGDLVLPRYHEDATDLHQVGFSLGIAMAQPITEISSPSHAVRVKTGDGDRSRVSLAADHDVPDRDLVLDVSTRQSPPRVLQGAGKASKTYFATVVPSHAFGEAPAAPRRVVFVLDRSGSMQGVPIQQAKKAMQACLGALAADDEFGIIAFDDQVEQLDAQLRKGDKTARKQALKFLEPIDGRGGTELTEAVSAAVKLLGRSAGDALIVTDGQVVGTEQILAEARAHGVRLHCLGIGSASQDRFLTLLARETGGVCRFLTPRERVDLPAVELFASIGRPLASEIKAHLEGVGSWRIAPDPASAIFAGTPLTLMGEKQGGTAQLIIEWAKPTTGKLALSLDAAPDGPGETLRLLQGSRLITDLESRYLGEASARVLDRREQKRLGDQLQSLSEIYGLASRRMSLVAVVERAGDQAGELPKTTVVAVGMPQDVKMGAYFMAMAGSPAPKGALPASPPMPMASAPSHAIARGAAGNALSGSASVLKQAWDKGRSAMRMKRVAMPPAPSVQDELAGSEQAPAFEPEDRLLELAQQLEPDGGMPGKDDFERMVRSLVALVAFLIEGHTQTTGAFRAHVQRLVHFVETSKFASLDVPKRQTLAAALARVKQGKKPAWPLVDLLTWKTDQAWEQISNLVGGGR